MGKLPFLVHRLYQQRFKNQNWNLKHRFKDLNKKLRPLRNVCVSFSLCKYLAHINGSPTRGKPYNIALYTNSSRLKYCHVWSFVIFLLSDTKAALNIGTQWDTNLWCYNVMNSVYEAKIMSSQNDPWKPIKLPIKIHLNINSKLPGFSVKLENHCL